MKVEYKIEDVNDKLKIELAKIPFVDPSIEIKEGKEYTVGIPVTIPAGMVAKIGEDKAQIDMAKGAVAEMINITMKELWLRVAGFNQKIEEITSETLAKRLVEEECFVITSGRVAAELLDYSGDTEELPMLVVSNYTIMTMGKGIMIVDPFLKWSQTPALFATKALINSVVRKIGETSGAFWVGASIQVSPFTIEVKTNAEMAEFTKGYNVTCAMHGTKQDIVAKDTPGLILPDHLYKPVKKQSPLDMPFVKSTEGLILPPDLK